MAKVNKGNISTRIQEGSKATTGTKIQVASRSAQRVTGDKQEDTGNTRGT